jgi:hypothetical protein
MKKIFILLSLLMSVNQASAFKLFIHERITKRALALDGFDEKTAQQVATNNWLVDTSPAAADSAAHADANNLDGASIRLKEKRDRIIENLQACKRGTAVIALGRGLHTVQDLYSHTNAVDDNLVPELRNEKLLRLPKGIEGICSVFGSNFAPSLVSGYFSLPDYIAGAVFGDGDNASCFGFISPTNFIENGNCCHLHLNKDDQFSINGSAIINGISKSSIAQIDAQVGTQDYLDLVYTKIGEDYPEDLEYYKNMLKNEQIRRMYVIDTTGSMEQDLISIKSELTSYLDTILQGQGTQAPTLGMITFKDNEEDQIESGLVCTTSEIQSLRDEINNLYAYGGDDCPESSAKALGAALDHFSSFPVNIVVPTSASIFIYTDAPSSNPGLFSYYVNKALNKSISVNPILTEGCEVSTKKNKIGFTQAYNQTSTKTYTKKEMLNFSKSSQEVYQDVAESTGGISINVNKIEVDKVIPITLFISDTGTELFYSQKLSVDSIAPSEPIIKIDSSMATGKTMIMIKTIDTAALPTISLSRPNGNVVLETDADVTVNNLSTIVTYTIDSPIQGDWKVSLSNGTSSYLVRAYAQTDFGIAGLSLLKQAPLNIRQVLFMPIEGNPIAGEELLLRVSLTQAPDTLTLKLLSENQTIISEPVLTLVENSTKSYEATIVVPNENFKIKLEGILNSSQFQREIALSLKPTKVKLAFDERLGFLTYELYGAQTLTSTFNVQITNKSTTAATYAISTNSQQKFVLNVPNQITVPAGQTLSIPVSVIVPADAIVGSIDEIMIIAEDINDDQNSNYKVANLVIRSDAMFSNSFE